MCAVLALSKGSRELCAVGLVRVLRCYPGHVARIYLLPSAALCPFPSTKACGVLGSPAREVCAGTWAAQDGEQAPRPSWGPGPIESGCSSGTSHPGFESPHAWLGKSGATKGTQVLALVRIGTGGRRGLGAWQCCWGKAICWWLWHSLAGGMLWPALLQPGQPVLAGTSSSTSPCFTCWDSLKEGGKRSGAGAGAVWFVVGLFLIRQSKAGDRKFRLETARWFAACLFCACLLSMDGCARAQACHSNCPRLGIQCSSQGWQPRGAPAPVPWCTGAALQAGLFITRLGCSDGAGTLLPARPESRLDIPRGWPRHGRQRRASAPGSCLWTPWMCRWERGGGHRGEGLRRVKVTGWDLGRAAASLASGLGEPARGELGVQGTV